MTTPPIDHPTSQRVRRAGGLLLAGLAASLLWRPFLAPAVLGDFDPAAMPGPQRGVLALGLLASALLAATGLACLARALRPAVVARAITAASVLAFAGTAVLAAQIVLLLTGGATLALFTLFVVLTTSAWMLSSVALVRAGILTWSGLLTALLSALALASLLLGAFVIFLMFLATLPLALGLLRRWSDAVTATGRAV